MWTDSRDLFLIKTVRGKRNLPHPGNTPKAFSADPMIGIDRELLHEF
jgi:hypothetical protein